MHLGVTYVHVCQTSGGREPRSYTSSALPDSWPFTILCTPDMTSEPKEGPAPNVRFKRRKITHSKRVYTNENNLYTEPQAPDAETQSANTLTPPTGSREDDEPVPNLRDIIRNRRHPADRVRDAARKSEAPRQELALIETPRDGQYTSRFVAQTGQVVDRDDTQM
jgi:hypothetical protein